MRRLKRTLHRRAVAPDQLAQLVPGGVHHRNCQQHADQHPDRIEPPGAQRRHRRHRRQSGDAEPDPGDHPAQQRPPEGTARSLLLHHSGHPQQYEEHHADAQRQHHGFGQRKFAQGQRVAHHAAVHQAGFGQRQPQQHAEQNRRRQPVVALQRQRLQCRGQ
ncbi:hypothetical protein SDC9_147713 [bioreactor metagenome]|uniref:Uncharacterized protein n=1 Tax=bioreactor metagenome TaxID=1076179 RepID=A0A645EES7_9ZZZZ